MILINTFKKFIPLYPNHIIRMNMLFDEDTHYGYSDIVEKFLIEGNHLIILLEVKIFLRNYIRRMNVLVICGVY